MRIGFWLLANNELFKSANMPKEALKTKIFVGNPENPIDIIRRDEITNYLDSEFYAQYNVWKKFHLGFGLPLDTSWANQPMFLMDIIETLESEYKSLENKGA